MSKNCSLRSNCYFLEYWRALTASLNTEQNLVQYVMSILEGDGRWQQRFGWYAYPDQDSRRPRHSLSWLSSSPSQSPSNLKEFDPDPSCWPQLPPFSKVSSESVIPFHFSIRPPNFFRPDTKLPLLLEPFTGRFSQRILVIGNLNLSKTWFSSHLLAFNLQSWNQSDEILSDHWSIFVATF